jgi:hypothetical protein
VQAEFDVARNVTLVDLDSSHDGSVYQEAQESKYNENINDTTEEATDAETYEDNSVDMEESTDRETYEDNSVADMEVLHLNNLHGNRLLHVKYAESPNNHTFLQKASRYVVSYEHFFLP